MIDIKQTCNPHPDLSFVPRITIKEHNTTYKLSPSTKQHNHNSPSVPPSRQASKPATENATHPHTPNNHPPILRRPNLQTLHPFSSRLHQHSSSSCSKPSTVHPALTIKGIVVSQANNYITIRASKSKSLIKKRNLSPHSSFQRSRDTSRGGKKTGCCQRSICT